MSRFMLLKKNQIFLILIVAIVVYLPSCNNKSDSSQARLAFESVTPKPVSAVASEGAFELNDKTTIVVEGTALTDVGEFLAAKLKPATGFNFPVTVEEAEESNNIYLTTADADPQWGEEGYQLTINENGIKLTANTPEGLFRGVQTLRQLLPETIEATTKQNGQWKIAAGTIVDYPNYKWRGAMLDVARHFFSVEDVKRYIDLISYYKINILHLHLTDDQGWRIEIKSWPNLTAIGGRTEVGGGEGGFYTQEQYAEIVAYAQSRFVTIVPEIDMPGHTNAALVSYPELNKGAAVTPANASLSLEQEEKDKPKAGEVYTGIEVGFSTLHLNNEITLQFVADVIAELAAMTPGPYLHIGGDESHVTDKEDYIEFVKEFRTMVASHGKKMIGWEEIAQSDIDATDIVQFWNSPEYLNLALEKGAKVILSPSKKIYLDMKYDSTTAIGLSWAAYIEVDAAYQWSPETIVEGIEKEQILGVEAPLWTETVETIDDIEYLVFPRLAGVAEIGWSPASHRDWDDYRKRLVQQAKRWEIMDIDYYKSPLIQWEK